MTKNRWDERTLDSYCGWKQGWYRPASTKRQVRAMYSSRQAYYDAFWLQDEVIIAIQENAMADFVRLEARLLRRTRRALHQTAGEAALHAFTTALATRQSSMPPEADFVFVSIDFEGIIQQQLLREFGVAKLDTRSFFDDTKSVSIATDIKGFDYRLQRRFRKFVFGDTKLIEAGDLPRTILETLSIKDDAQYNSMRKIILLSHGIQNEITALDNLGLSLECLPQVIGVLDTGWLGKAILGAKCGSLEQLLTELGIPWRDRLMHCAGNDAHFALQALLALLQTRLEGRACESTMQRLDALARQPAPMPPVKEKCEEEDWGSFLECDMFEMLEGME